MSELEANNQAGYLRTPEQAELIESKAFEDGYQTCVNDASAGLLKGTGIYTTSQVMDFMEMYRTAIQQTILNDLNGTAALSHESVRLHLCQQIIQGANEKFGELIPTDKKAKQSI